MKKIWIVMIALLSLGLVAAAGYYGFDSSQPKAVSTPQPPTTIPVTVCDVEQTITAPGSLVNTRETKLEIPFTGKLAEISVRPGDRVSAGQVLARLDDAAQYDADIAAANLEVLKARTALDALYADAPLKAAQAQLAVAEAQKALEEAQKERDRLDYPRASAAMIDEAKARLVLAHTRLDMAQSVYNDLSELSAEDPERAAALLDLSNAQREYMNAVAVVNWYIGNPSQTEIAETDAQLAVAEATLAQAQATLNAITDGPDALAVALAEATLADAEARLATAQNVLTQLEITAPFDGVILEVSARTNETIPGATAIFVINDPLSVEVETTVIEEDLPYVAVGQPAEVYFDALPGEIITGTVTRIVPKRAAGDRPLYYVYLALEKVPPALTAGMSADSSIVIAQRPGVLCLPRALAQAAADGTATVEVWSNWSKQKRTIEVGLRGDTYVEILSGLKEGELVVAK